MPSFLRKTYYRVHVLRNLFKNPYSIWRTELHIFDECACLSDIRPSKQRMIWAEGTTVLPSVGSIWNIPTGDNCWHLLATSVTLLTVNISWYSNFAYLAYIEIIFCDSVAQLNLVHWHDWWCGYICNSKSSTTFNKISVYMMFALHINIRTALVFS